MMSEERNTHARENSAPPHVVLTNDDLLTEILIRLPILCIHLFTTVSKQWQRILTSPVFTLNSSKITKVDPPVGLFVNHIRSSFHCDFVLLDPKIKSRKYTIDKSFTLGSTEAVDNVNILQSCNDSLVCTDYIGSREFTIYEKGCFVWSIKYLVDTNDFMSPLPEIWSIRSIVWSIVLGEREEDSFVVINLSRKVVEYNLISKTLCEIYDMGPNQVADDYPDGFISPFAMYDMGSKKVDHNVYEFIPSSASI
ncbi:retrovirus-related pol polyprotein from transposon TNT 1-94 [Tanacetum coccineum]